MKNLIVIQEKNLEDNEHTVIGVADSLDKANKIIKQYYGEYKIISYINNNPILYSKVEYSMILELKGISGEPYEVEVFLEWFTLNEL
jgi:hypothetical protein